MNSTHVPEGLSDIHLRLLTAADAPAYQALRNHMLGCAPTAFTSDLAACAALPASHCAARLGTPEDAGFFIGALNAAGRLRGCVGCERARRTKERHRAAVVGMVVMPAAQGQGVGRQLLAACVAQALRMHGVQQPDLTVTAGSTSAAHLYEAAGFRVRGSHPNATVVDAVAFDKLHMQMRLAPCLNESLE